MKMTKTCYEFGCAQDILDNHGAVLVAESASPEALFYQSATGGFFHGTFGVTTSPSTHWFSAGGREVKEHRPGTSVLN